MVKGGELTKLKPVKATAPEKPPNHPADKPFVEPNNKSAVPDKPVSVPE